MKASICAALVSALTGATERYAAYSPSYAPVASYGGYGGYANAGYGGYGNGLGGYGASYGRYGGAGLNSYSGNSYGLNNGYTAITPGPIKQVPIGLRKFGSPYKPANQACYGPWCES